MVRHNLSSALIGLLAICPVGVSYAQELTIQQIQSHTSDGDASLYDGEIRDGRGGCVTHIWTGTWGRVYLQDPANITWGAICVRDAEGDLISTVQVGDWISFDQILIQEHRGMTFLQYNRTYAPDVIFTIESSGNYVPAPTVLTAADIPAPVEHPGDEWHVEDHNAEPYESMRLVVRDVTVTRMHLGKASDNYNLRTPAEEDCWATDYQNADKEPSGYHRFVTADQHFCAVVGVLEQYTKLSSGWDYYQLITMKTEDLAICGDGDSDGDLDIDDWPRFHTCFVGPQCGETGGGCNPAAWTLPPTELALEHCLMMDLDYDGDVDLRDFAELQVIFDAQ